MMLMNLFYFAWPKFRENNIPVTLFISTEIIDNKTNGYMTWDQIRNFIDEGGNSWSTYIIP